MASTRFFKSCLGVFQGGGCRGAALAGAYAAAIESGVHFAEVAGTSAGSIIAVLVGAGASPEFVWKKLSELEFERFLQKPDPVEPSVGWLSRYAISWKSKELAEVLRRGGLYSSSYIETWVDDALAELLPDAPRPIQFGSLVKPTYVVASNVDGAKVHVWSKPGTNEEPVGTAVRASCSIPFFFQAVRHGKNKFVDGGMLSNLPLFVFSPTTGARRPSSSKILAFRLESDFRRADTDDLFDFTKALTNVIVDGATELQCRLHRELHEIRIPTGNVTATDFERLANDENGELIRDLYCKGKVATESFIANELMNVRSKSGGAIECDDEDATYFEIIELGDQNPTEIFIVSRRARWAWDLFPTLINWIRKGIEIRVLLETASNDPAEKQRRDLVRKMIPNVHVTDEVPFEGFLFRNSEVGDFSAVVFHAESERDCPAAAKYSGDLHTAAVSALFSMVEQKFTSQRNNQSPKLVAVQSNRYFELLKKGVAQYNDARFSIKRLPVSELFLTAGDIREYKYRQIVSLANLYDTYSLDLFGPVQVEIGEFASLVTPPVVEASSEKSIVIQGNTRAAYCHLNSIRELNCIVVDGVSAPLPVTPVEIRRMRVVTQRQRPELNYGLFRKVERAVRPYK
ncbi:MULTISPECIES: patatin-like phospholipase family protein [Pirellulaceae]|uniref:patatin-like phospholipase family protein n=1 Tax=Pirellulaceae TaxID=2691357 RepID=UPI001304C411|nr:MULTISPECIES: patatin-like phospholipase family protein [Pirellulaceae]